MADERGTEATGKLPACPICGRPGAKRFRPFCSAGCRDRDLVNWLDGRYGIPAQEAEPESDDGEGG